MTTTTDPWAALPKQVTRDRLGRYVVPDPKTGKQTSWTRVTTLAKVLDDNHALEKWTLRTATAGLIARPDLFALAHTQLDDNRALDRTLQDALEAGSASAGANTGTALHALTEHADRGTPITAPPDLQADLDAYTRTLAAAGITIDPDLIEQVLLLTGQPEPVAGTADRFVTLPDGRRVIADLKTGRSLDYAWGSIAIQLACYAHATHTWDPTTATHAKAPKVDLERALVIHLPAGQARCTLHLVDIAAGWEAAQTAFAVRAWRKQKNLATVLDLGPAAPAPETLRADLLRRVRGIVDAGHAQDLARLWPHPIPTFRDTTHAHTVGELEQVAAAINTVEQAHDLPF